MPGQQWIGRRQFSVMGLVLTQHPFSSMRGGGDVYVMSHVLRFTFRVSLDVLRNGLLMI